MSRTARLCLALATIGVLLLSACGLLHADDPVTSTSRAAAATPAVRYIRQIDFGRDASFTRCVEPTCPSISLKTLASLSAPAAPPVPRTTTPPAVAGASGNPQPTDPAATTLRTATSRKLILHFGSNSSILTGANRALLGSSLSELRHADRIVIIGRTDDLGSEPLNEALALARALAIRDHLLDLAPDLPARIAIEAKGRCCYTAPNDSGSGRAQNRRVELAYMPRDEGAQ